MYKGDTTHGKVILAEGLRKTYRTGGKLVEALRGVDLEVKKGRDRVPAGSERGWQDNARENTHNPSFA